MENEAMRKVFRHARSGVVIAASLFLACPSYAAARKLIWNFDDTLTNTLGGGYNVFSRSPSWARTYLDPNVHLPDTHHALRVTAHRAGDGFCGVWFDFYPAQAAPRRYFDARGFRYLTFWIKGAKSGWDFNLKLVDATGERNEDALATRRLDAYLPQGITTAWQKVSIPLADFPEIDPGSLARFVLMFNTPGDYQFYLDDVALEAQRNGGSVLRATKPLPPLRSAPSLPNAMWVWRTGEIFTGSREPGRLFAFCARMNVRTVYLSLDFRQTPSGRPVAIEKTRLYQTFLQRAHRRGLRVDALAGSPEWAVARYHERALDAVRLVADFNRTAPAGSRFDGVHFDVEPYVLIGFADPASRKLLLKDYLGMVAACEAQARKEGLDLSCDVPWWFFPASPAARQAMTVNFAGQKKTVGELLLDLLPSVTIMDYRNEADGTGGIIAFGQPALAEAVQSRKKIVIGLETSAEKPEPVDFVLAVPRGSFWHAIEQAGLYGERSFEGYGLYALKGGKSIFVGLGPPLRGAPQPAETFEAAFVDLRKTFGVKPGEFEVEPLLREAAAAVARDPEWRDFSDYRMKVPGEHDRLVGFQAIHQTAPTITFHGLGRKVFEEETHSALEWLGQSPAFAGLAFHYYDSLRELMATP
jgi:hypothetical protein